MTVGLDSPESDVPVVLLLATVVPILLPVGPCWGGLLSHLRRKRRATITTTISSITPRPTLNPKANLSLPLRPEHFGFEFEFKFELPPFPRTNEVGVVELKVSMPEDVSEFVTVTEFPMMLGLDPESRLDEGSSVSAGCPLDVVCHVDEGNELGVPCELEDCHLDVLCNVDEGSELGVYSGLEGGCEPTAASSISG